MLVDGSWVLALTNNLEQVLIGQEVEAGEDTSLTFEEGTQLFLNGLEAAIHLKQLLDEVLLVNDQGAVATTTEMVGAVLLLEDSAALASENLINLLESSVFTTELLGQIRLTLEDTFKILPLALHLEEQLDSLSDGGNVVLPEVNLLRELLVVWGRLVGGQVLGMLFDKGHNLISTSNFVEVFWTVLGPLASDFEVGHGILLPNALDFNQRFFDLQLVSSVVAQVVDEDLEFLQLEFENALQVEVVTLLIEFFFDLESNVVPVTGSDRLISQGKSQWQDLSEEQELLLQEIE